MAPVHDRLCITLASRPTPRSDTRSGFKRWGWEAKCKRKTINYTGPRAVYEFGRGIDENLKLSSRFPDKEIARFVIDYAFKEIVPLDPLRDLEAHAFVAPEDRRFQKQYWQTNIAIVLAFVVGAAGVWWSYCALTQQNTSSAVQAENGKTNHAVTEARFAAESAWMKDIQSSLKQIEKAIQSSFNSGITTRSGTTSGTLRTLGALAQTLSCKKT